MADPKITLPEPGVFSELASILFPVRCVHCSGAGNWLCPSCARQMAFLGPGFCRRCGRPGPADTYECPECRGRDLRFSGARAAFRFEGPARSLVHRLKYSGQRRLATFMAAISAPLLKEYLQTMGFSPGLTRAAPQVNLTYVPLHRAKLVSRGYNQAGMYAGALARNLGMPLADLLAKHHPTTPQNRLDSTQRRKNIGKSISPKRGAGRRVGTGGTVILVDDVYTTGATAAECAKILKEGLGVETYIWTFARTVRR